jgi:uncharacterized protein
VTTTFTEAVLSAADWQQAADDLDAVGCASTPLLLTRTQCQELVGLYDRPELFRATIDMARHRFGSGQYRYFTHDLPDPVRALREAYQAGDWNALHRDLFGDLVFHDA